ncbi:MAG: alkaline phosphatase family protein [Bacteroidales bacterium]|nr:alkaline phosphatase family protein [Bacteroidales bacterium]
MCLRLLFKKIFIFFLFTSIVSRVFSQETTPPDKPKLVVLVIVEQMRYEYLERFSSHFSSGGFKKLMYSGSHCVDAHVNFSYGQSATGYASIVTGTTPSNHGIIGNSWYNRKTKTRINSVLDDDYPSTGNDTHDEYQVSAKNLIATTFGDELATQSFGKSRSFSISLDQQAAVLCAGHKSNGVFWLDEYTGNWMSGTYYNNVLPTWLHKFNDKGLANVYINRTWNTFLPITKYKESTRDDAKYEIGIRNQIVFPYYLPKIKDNYKPYKILKTTPYGNTYTKDLAIELIEKEQLGKTSNLDFLTIAFTATEEIGNKFGCLSKEIEDTYIRLDFELMFFLNYLETHIGKDNFLLILTSNHGMSISPKCESQKTMKLGIFKPVETMYLLDKHLDVTFGEDNWIEHYQDMQIYLNLKTLKNRNLTIAEVEDDCCEFLTQLSGVQSAIGSVWLANHNFCSNDTYRMVDNSYNIERSANIFLTLKPGWGEQTVESVGSHLSPYNYDTHVPLIWYGWKMKSKIIHQPIEITDIIVSLCEITKTTRPNMATGKVIDALLK